MSQNNQDGGQNMLIKVQVIPSGDLIHQASPLAPEKLTDDKLDSIAHVINRAVNVMQEQIDFSMSESSLVLSEIEFTFGIDFEAKSSIPIVGPIVGIGVQAGATFQVHIKLERQA